MNEVIFGLHILADLVFLALAVRYGKTALGIYIALSGILANLFVVKQIQLFGLMATASDVFAVGGIFALNLLQELHGQQAANRATIASLGALVFFAFMSQIHLSYIPSPHDATHVAFHSVLSSTPRIVAVSIGVYYLVQRLDLLFFGALKSFIAQFEIRVLASLLVSQALDTALFSFFGLYGIVDALFQIMIISYAIKCVVILCSSPLASVLKRFVRREI